MYRMQQLGAKLGVWVIIRHLPLEAADNSLSFVSWGNLKNAMMGDSNHLLALFDGSFQNNRVSDHNDLATCLNRWVPASRSGITTMFFTVEWCSVRDAWNVSGTHE